eukprot:Gb_14091 [translate_table: standard]
MTQFLLKCGLSSSEIALVTKVRPSLLNTKTTRTAQQAVDLLKQKGFNETLLKSVITINPSVIAYTVKNLKPKLGLLESLGLAGDKLANVCIRRPRIITCNFEHSLLPRVKFLQTLFGSEEHLLKALKLEPEILLVDVEKRLKPALKLLQDYGITGDSLDFLLARRPRVVTRNSAESLANKLECVRKMGVAESSRMFVYALVTVDSLSPETLRTKLKEMACFGLLETEVLEVVRKMPDLLSNSAGKTRNTIDFLVNSAGLPANVVVIYPFLLKYNFERRIKPRYRVFEWLKENDPSHLRRSLPGVILMPEKRFLAEVVECSSRPSEHKADAAVLIIIDRWKGAILIRTTGLW